MKKVISLLLPLAFMQAQTPAANGFHSAVTARRVVGLPSRNASAASPSVVIQGRVLPLILSDSTWETTVVLVNTGSASVAFQQFFFAADGKPASYTIHASGSFRGHHSFSNTRDSRAGLEFKVVVVGHERLFSRRMVLAYLR